MTRDYGRQSTARKSKSSPPWVIICLSFFCGFFAASFFKTDGLGQWLHSQVQAYQQAKPEPQMVVHKARSAAKPKFEFYTLLTNEKAPAQIQSNPVAQVEENKPQSPQVTTNKPAQLPKTTLQPSKNVAVHLEPPKTSASTKANGSFLIQVASFKARKDAEQMKALLTLKGYEVTVAPVTNPNGNWFRVIIGPYNNRLQAQKAQLTLSKTERLNGMVRSVGG